MSEVSLVRAEFNFGCLVAGNERWSRASFARFRNLRQGQSCGGLRFVSDLHPGLMHCVDTSRFPRSAVREGQFLITTLSGERCS